MANSLRMILLRFRVVFSGSTDSLSAPIDPHTTPGPREDRAKCELGIYDSPLLTILIGFCPIIFLWALGLDKYPCFRHHAPRVWSGRCFFVVWGASHAEGANRRRPWRARLVGLLAQACYCGWPPSRWWRGPPRRRIGAPFGIGFSSLQATQRSTFIWAAFEGDFVLDSRTAGTWQQGLRYGSRARAFSSAGGDLRRPRLQITTGAVTSSIWCPWTIRAQWDTAFTIQGFSERRCNSRKSVYCPQSTIRLFFRLWSAPTRRLDVDGLFIQLTPGSRGDLGQPR